MIIKGSFCLFLHKNIRCEYSLELPQQGTSNEYPHHMFLWRGDSNEYRYTQHTCFYGELIKIILKLSSNALLFCSTAPDQMPQNMVSD